MTRRIAILLSFICLVLMACFFDKPRAVPKPNEGVVIEPIEAEPQAKLNADAEPKDKAKNEAKEEPKPQPKDKIEVAEPAPKPKTKSPPAYLTPNLAANVGTFKIELVRGALGRVPLLDTIRRRPAESENELAAITIRIGNSSENKLQYYIPWTGHEFSSLDADHASLRDEFGNRYTRPRWAFGLKVEKQLTHRTRIDPGDSISDILVFDLPISNAKEFTLTLPGSNIGHREASIVYKIPLWFLRGDEDPEIILQRKEAADVAAAIKRKADAEQELEDQKERNKKAERDRILAQEREKNRLWLEAERKKPRGPTNPKVTKANLDRVQKGWTINQARGVLGDETSQKAVPGTGLYEYTWEDGARPRQTILRIYFQAGGVLSKKLVE